MSKSIKRRPAIQAGWHCNRCGASQDGCECDAPQMIPDADFCVDCKSGRQTAGGVYDVDDNFHCDECSSKSANS